MVEFFKQQYNVDERKEKCNKLKLRKKGHIPIVCESESIGFSLKYLVQPTMTSGQFFYQVRKRLKFRPEYALFFRIVEGESDIFITPNRLMSELYLEYKESDGFMYMLVCKEKTFGSD